MTSAEMIEFTFTALEITGNATLLTQGVKGAVSAGDQLVRICLMTDIPDHTVLVQIKGLIQGKGQFNNAQTRAEMPAAVGNNLEMAFSDLFRNVLELCNREPMQLIGMG